MPFLEIQKKGEPIPCYFHPKKKRQGLVEYALILF